MKLGRNCLLICEGYTNSTQIFERQLREIFPSVRTIEVKQLCGTRIQDQHLVFLRVCHPQWHWIVDYLNERDARYDYLIDDNFFEISSSVDPYNGPLYDHPATHATLSHYIANARTVVTFSAPFASELKRRIPRAHVETLPAAVDMALFEKHCADSDRSDNRVLRVGYATTPRVWLSSFIADLVLATTDQLGSAVEFEFVGWWPHSIAAHPRVKTFEAIRDYEAYVGFVGQRAWDLGIAPLGDSLFENCKTNNKFREYAAARVPAIYSDVPLYRSCVDSNVTGWLEPNDPELWARRIAAVAVDPSLRRRVADTAHRVVAETYAQPIAAKALARALGIADAQQR